MKSFKQYITEWSDNLFKGWVNVKTRKIISNTHLTPYHVQMVMMDPKSFGISEKQIKSYLEDKVKGWGAEDDPAWIANEVESAYENLLSGKQDINRVIEMMAMKKGWCRFAQSKSYMSVDGSGKLDNLRQACIILDQKHSIFSEGFPVGDLEVTLKYIVGTMNVKTKKMWDVRGSKIRRWLRRGGDPNRLPKETKRQDVTVARMSGRYPPGHDEWGSVKGRKLSKKYKAIHAHRMLSFKDFIVELASPYETNPYVKKALKKYDDPVKFLINMMHIVPKLPRMGKKNTLELIKVWNDNKSKKINAALVEQVLLERPAKFTSYLPGYETMMKTERGLENPSVAELTSFINNTKHKEVRIVLDARGHMRVWDANNSIHQEVVNGEGLNVDKLALGVLRLHEGGIWLIMLQNYGGRDKYAKKNKTLVELMKDKDNEVTNY